MFTNFYFLYSKKQKLEKLAKKSWENEFLLLMKLTKLIILFFLIVGLNSCIEPFSATVGNKASGLLVVDGLITNENVVHTVKLSRSLANIDEEPVAVTNARVVIVDDLGTSAVLTEKEPGIYVTDTGSFCGVPGRTYTLYISTIEGKEYRSTPCLMEPSSEIDSIFFKPGKDLNSETDREYNGIGIYVNGNAGAEEINYLRWSFREDWKFGVPYYPYEIPTPEGGWEPYDANRYCWKSAVSGSIDLYSFENQSGKKVVGKELCFINSQTSDRLSKRYRIIVSQFSISKEEYEFWRKLEKSDSGGGTFFGEQPFSISGNIMNINDPNEDVLGYFQVAGYSSKTLYINRSQLYDWRLPIKNCFASCKVDTFLLADLNKIAIEQGFPVFINMYDIYERFVLKRGDTYQLAYPVYGDFGINAIGLGLTKPRCADCSLSGEKEPPPFWVDEY